MKLLTFGSDWCSGCKSLKSSLKNLLIETEDFDIDLHSQTFKKYEVKTLPTMVLLDNNGFEIQRLTGSQTLATLQQLKERIEND